MSEQNSKSPIDYLIVDSLRERREAAETILGTNKQCHVASFSDGRAAREALFTHQVSFVIAAENMPRMTGIEFLRLIRRIPGYLTLPVLLLLDEENPEKASFAKEEGANYVLTGPLTEPSLQTAITFIRKQNQEQNESQKLLQKARALFLQREYDQAIQATQSIEELSNNPEALHLLCECYYRQKNYEKAQQYLKKIITSPTGRTMHLLSKVCMAENQCGDAITHLTKANLRYPDNLDLKIDLGKLYLNLGMEEQAKEQFEAVMQKNPSDINLIKMGKAYMVRGKLKEAATFLDRAEQPIPEAATIFARFAAALENEDDLPAACRQYEKCLQLLPDNTAVLLNLSKLYLKTGRRDEASTIINDLHQRFPDNEKINNIFQYLQDH